MTRADHILLPVLLLGLAGIVSATGCSATREPRPTVDPSFSIRANNPNLAAADLWPDQPVIAQALESDADLISLNDTADAPSVSTASLDELTDLLRSE